MFKIRRTNGPPLVPYNQAMPIPFPHYLPFIVSSSLLPSAISYPFSDLQKPWLRRIFASLSLRKPRFDPCVGYMKSVVKNCHCCRFFCRYSCFSDTFILPVLHNHIIRYTTVSLQMISLFAMHLATSAAICMILHNQSYDRC